jgi:hypothetical protein
MIFETATPSINVALIRALPVKGLETKNEGL